MVWQQTPGGANFDYLLSMPMNWFTRERKKLLTEEMELKMKEREILLMKTAAQMWRDDLDRFLQLLEEQEEQEAAAASAPPSPVRHDVSQPTEEASQLSVAEKTVIELPPVDPLPELPIPVPNDGGTSIEIISNELDALDLNELEENDSPVRHYAHPKKRQSMSQYFSFIGILQINRVNILIDM